VDLKHPPEYELKPSDLEAVGSADIIIYAGYERFAQKLAETAGSAGLKVLRIATSNKPSELKAEARKIAEALGTVGRFEEWSRNFDSFAADLRTKVLAAYSGRGAVVQRMQRPFVEWLGLDISGEFGPAEPSPAVILQLVRIKPALVIDNYHNPSGRPIAEAAGAAYADLINFPGRDGTKTIEDVFRYNAEILIKAASK
jgi:ABC-type Fe3+-hydroxamate transport system substrate-binding protein